MLGGGLGGFAPGEWTDDNTMAWCILDVAASHDDLRSDDALTQIARRFCRRYETGPSDIGNQTRMILGAVGPDPTGAALTATSFDLHRRTSQTAGNGSLMRTAPVALRYLGDPEGLTAAARRISALTHYDRQAQDACALWSLAIRRAIVTSDFNLRAVWTISSLRLPRTGPQPIEEAEQREPGDFNPNGWVVTAFQAAWSAIVHTPIPEHAPNRHLSDALDTAIRIGDDTDTVAAIAGGLLGARWGAESVPPPWRTRLHGYPGITYEDLLTLVDQAVS